MVWLSVHIQLMNPNAYPANDGDVRAALPTRVIRESNERQPHRSINPATRGWPSPVSHKV